MTGASQDWVIVAVFFFAFAAMTIGEMYWLVSSSGVASRKAATAVLLPNFLTITLGFFVTFIIFGFLLALTGSNAEGGSTAGAGTRIAFLAALSFPVLLMAVSRRLLIGGLRIEQIERPLRYAILSTFAFFVAVFGIPGIFLTLR